MWQGLLHRAMQNDDATQLYYILEVHHFFNCIYLEDDARTGTWTWSRTVPSSKPKPNRYPQDKPYWPMGEAGSCTGYCCTCDESCQFDLYNMWANRRGNDPFQGLSKLIAQRRQQGLTSSWIWLLHVDVDMLDLQLLFDNLQKVVMHWRKEFRTVFLELEVLEILSCWLDDSKTCFSISSGVVAVVAFPALKSNTILIFLATVAGSLVIFCSASLFFVSESFFNSFALSFRLMSGQNPYHNWRCSHTFLKGKKMKVKV